MLEDRFRGFQTDSDGTESHVRCAVDTPRARGHCGFKSRPFLSFSRDSPSLCAPPRRRREGKLSAAVLPFKMVMVLMDIDSHSDLSRIREFEEVDRLQDQSVDDPIQPWLSLIEKYVHDFRKSKGSNSSQLIRILEEAISRFQQVDRYLGDIRFLKIWVIYADVIEDFKKVYEMMNKKGIGKGHSFLYEAYAVHLELMGRWDEAHSIYRLGISWNAKPLERLEKMHKLFLERVAEANISLANEVEAGNLIKDGGVDGTNPWSQSTIAELLEKTKKNMHNYEGYYRSAKSYPGKLPSSSGNLSRNMIVELGRKKYQIKGCAGKGGYAQVFKSHVYGNPEETVALKVALFLSVSLSLSLSFSMCV
ncbi:Mitotic checkpoint serine/threonine-protein kinase [Nymphaea thermarum]|nr:Mitotic checkpoint serine/threonine-protein kinase [Nymphaea thermarum]